MSTIMAQLAYEIAQTMKAPAQSKKAHVERTQNRVRKSQEVSIPDRDGKKTKEADEADTQKGDEFHAQYGESY